MSATSFERASNGLFLPARVSSVAEAGSELGIVIIGPPLQLTGFWVVVESKEVELHLNHRGVEIPGSKVTVKAAEATEAAPFHQTFGPFAPAQWGELVAVGKTIGGATFINITPVATQ